MSKGVAEPECSRAWWEDLRNKTKNQLLYMGLGAWGEGVDGDILMLFPREWYDRIPDGFEVETINDTKEPFINGKTDNDYRFGCLAYGISVTNE